MQERQVFRLIVRTIGFVALVYSTFALFQVTAKLFGISVPSHTGLDGHIAAGVFYLLLGFVIIRFSEWITWFVYDDESN
jgi:uncharacterized membrane protein